PPPPTSTPFPYTTLFRSRRARVHERRIPEGHAAPGLGRREHRGPPLRASVHRGAPAPQALRQLRAQEEVPPPLRARRDLRFRAQDRKSTRLNSSHDQISY